MKGRRLAAPSRRDGQLPSGTITLPGYGNITELATGTFATVYRGTELGTGRPVALKIMRVANTSPQVLEAFKKELSALALLSNHPNVTTLYRSFFTPMGRPVLVLELCRSSLAQTVREKGPLSPREAVAVGVKVAGALETAHRSGFLHRDLKPQNILVSQFGEPVLADFGVAAIQAVAESTEGLFGFTTLHAAPEVLEGSPGSPAADIYGLGSSLYQLLLGKGPFAAYEGESPASVILRILRDPAPRPPLATVPVALADVISACLDKDPARRPQSAAQLAESLRAVELALGWPQTPYVVWGDGAATDADGTQTCGPGTRQEMQALGGTTPKEAPAPGGAPAPKEPPMLDKGPTPKLVLSGASQDLGQPVSPLPPPLFAAPATAPKPVSYIATPPAREAPAGLARPSGWQAPAGAQGRPDRGTPATAPPQLRRRRGREWALAGAAVGVVVVAALVTAVIAHLF